MSAKFYTLLTDIGAAKLASAAALGVPLKITHMAVGSGGGVLPTPNAQQTALVAEERRAALNMLYIDPQNSSQIIAEQVIPENEGGWWIREVGLFDDTGALIAVGNCPESYKPQLAEGSGRTQTVRMVLITSSTDNITLKIDPAVVLATRKYVDDKVLELKVYVDELMAKHLAAADPHAQYAPKESPTLTGTPKAPTALAGNNSTQIANTAFVQAVVTALNNALALKAPLASPALTGTPTAPTAAQTVNNTQVATTAFVKSAIAALVASSPAALDTLNELAEALGNDPNFATTMTNALAGKQPLDDTLTSLSGKSISDLLQYLDLGVVLHAGKNLYEIAEKGAAHQASARDNLALNAIAAIVGGKNKLPYFADMNTAALADFTAFARTLLSRSDASAVRGDLALNAIAAIVGGTNKLPYFADMNTAALADFTAFAKTLLSRTDASAVRGDLGLKSAALREVGVGENQIPDISSFANSPYQNGFMKLPGGLMLQWGLGIGVNGIANITFNQAFVNRPFYVGFGYKQSTFPSAMQSIIINDEYFDNTAFSARTLMFDGTTMAASPNAFLWFALGVG